MKYLLNLIVALLLSVTATAQEVEMADTMHSNGKIYVVVAVIMIIFAGIIVNMIRLEKKMNRIEREQAK